ncbi:hypothetical protein M422DRAFT_34944 [Sphaerobolus stellatus SS14]|uniref:Uncharacterized protein n=1 Tax=Sphaerobolus stellatus (strain SS14) TaxID=990650 RepID=A0A0C9UJ21_SPHS4|nr:hypothetical protein M422DRAFT_34944 [Sphaerobolus stellatus SS14]
MYTRDSDIFFSDIIYRSGKCVNYETSSGISKIGVNTVSRVGYGRVGTYTIVLDISTANHYESLSLIPPWNRTRLLMSTAFIAVLTVTTGLQRYAALRNALFCWNSISVVSVPFFDMIFLN